MKKTMKKTSKIISIFLSVIMLLGTASFSVLAEEETSAIITSTRGNTYGTNLTLPVTGETVKSFKNNDYSNLHNDDGGNGRKVSEAIVEFELMFPLPVNPSDRPYVFLNFSTGKEDGTTLASYQLFQFWAGGVRMREGLPNAFGIDSNNNANVKTANGSTGDSFDIVYDTWNKYRLVFSATNNTIKLYNNEDLVTYTYVDGTGIDNNVWKIMLNFRTNNAADRVYMKNAKAYHVYFDASDSDKALLANESGIYAHNYDVGSGVFSYKTNYPTGKTYGVYATVTGFKDANPETAGIYELPEGSEFTIPNYIDGYPVKAIDDHAFSRKDTNANLPGEDANAKASDGRYINIQKINMPNSVTTIHDYAFYAMHGVKEINLPSELTTIGDFAFANNFSVDKITFNDKLTTIGKNAFDNLGNLTTGNATFKGPVLKNDQNHRIARIDIPESVTTINNFAFQNIFSKTFVIHGSAKKYGSGVFKWFNANELVIMGDITFDEGVNLFDSGSNRYRISNLYCSDNTYEIINAMKANGIAAAPYTSYTYKPVWVDTDNKKSYLMSGTADAFMAYYNEDGSLAYVSEIQALDATDATDSADIIIDPEVYSTKAFMWSDFEECKPLCKSVEFVNIISPEE